MISRYAMKEILKFNGDQLKSNDVDGIIILDTIYNRGVN